MNTLVSAELLIEHHPAAFLAQKFHGEVRGDKHFLLNGDYMVEMESEEKTPSPAEVAEAIRQCYEPMGYKVEVDPVLSNSRICCLNVSPARFCDVGIALTVSCRFPHCSTHNWLRITICAY